jgi:hypothetical protein
MRRVNSVRTKRTYCVPSLTMIEKVVGTRVNTIFPGEILEVAALTRPRWLLAV